ncbi:MAG: flagellar basal-body rod modification protein FlgD [Desulfobacteraceae bacterium Eth-SRB1]|nr:MAG: flagellar basal-body rod modification protein FlgD [Desulfobacteraceae bacterium Eth-SRB1]
MTDIESVIGSSESLQALQTSSTIGKDEFFKMMIAQLQHQDPLNPLDGTDFTAQLAQFSSLEQLSNVNDQLKMLGLYQASLNNSQSISLIGKEITAIGNVIKVDGASADLAYNLSEGAEKVTISIYDEGGSLVDTLEPGSQQEGENSVTWDCSGVAGGNYTFEVSATDANGDVAPAYTMITGKVTGIAFKGGFYPYLSVNGQDIPLGSIISVNETG